MLRTITFLVVAALALPAGAQSQNQMTGEQLTKLTAKGRTLTLGGPDLSYDGQLKLKGNGTGKGIAKAKDGSWEVKIEGTWEIRGNEFCRTWKGLNDGKELCEQWILRSPTSVEVFDGDRSIGVNSW